MYQKKDFFFCCKNEPSMICQFNVVMAHMDYFRQNNLWILKLTNIQRLKITILSANLQLFRLERISKCSDFILFTHKTANLTDL